MRKGMLKRVLSFLIGLSMIVTLLSGLYYGLLTIVGMPDANEIYLFTIGVFCFIVIAAFFMGYGMARWIAQRYINAWERENDWILCSEDMPEENDQYLCVDSKGKQYICDYGYSHEKEKMAFFHARAVVDVVAWQDLQELPLYLQKSESQPDSV